MADLNSCRICLGQKLATQPFSHVGSERPIVRREQSTRGILGRLCVGTKLLHESIETDGERLKDVARSSWTAEANEGASADTVRDYHASFGRISQGISTKGCRLYPDAIDVCAMSRPTVDDIAASVRVMKKKGVAARGGGVLQ